MHSRFQSIAAQVASCLRDEIHTGVPLQSERMLSQRLQVSRRTVRKALSFLRAEGLVRMVDRQLVRVVPARKDVERNRPLPVNLLLPEPLEQARPFTALWVNHLTQLLRETGSRLEVLSGQRYYGARSSRSLSNLVTAHPARCWIIARSNQPMQQWFDHHGLKALVAGSTYAGITLPSVDTDHGALSRHAAAQLLRHGHTRIALFFDTIRHAGDVESEQGFRSAATSHPRRAELIVCRVERTPNAVVRELKRLLEFASPPTGFFLSNSFSYLTVLGYLTSIGRRNPQDFSLISQDEGPFLAHVYPAPARYCTNPKKYAAAVGRAVNRVLENDVPREFNIRIMPDFVPGASIAAVASPPA